METTIKWYFKEWLERGENQAELQGFDEEGNEYSATGFWFRGEADDIENIERLPPITEEERKEKILAHFEIHQKVKAEGYSGILSTGMIVDRRIYPQAIPMQKNTMLGIPEPKKL